MTPSPGSGLVERLRETYKLLDDADDCRICVDDARDAVGEAATALESAYARIAELEAAVGEEEIATQEAVGLMSEELSAAVHAAHIAGMEEAAGIAEDGVMCGQSEWDSGYDTACERAAERIRDAIRLAANSKGEKG